MSTTPKIEKPRRTREDDATLPAIVLPNVRDDDSTPARGVPLDPQRRETSRPPPLQVPKVVEAPGPTRHDPRRE